MISEIDKKDWEMSPQPSKLYDVPRNSLVTPVKMPNYLIMFDHVDGMYSLCHSMKTGEIMHIGASTEVNVWIKKGSK